jgi:hypothetical protein
VHTPHVTRAWTSDMLSAASRYWYDVHLTTYFDVT